MDLQQDCADLQSHHTVSSRLLQCLRLHPASHCMCVPCCKHPQQAAAAAAGQLVLAVLALPSHLNKCSGIRTRLQALIELVKQVRMQLRASSHVTFAHQTTIHSELVEAPQEQAVLSSMLGVTNLVSVPVCPQFWLLRENRFETTRWAVCSETPCIDTDNCCS